MTLLKDGQNLYIRRGDTGQVTYKGLPTDNSYSVYLSIYNPDNFNILKEIEATFTRATGTAIVSFSTTITDALPVGEWEYALKICAGDSEDTVLPRAYTNEQGELVKEPAPKFTVDEKLVEGN